MARAEVPFFRLLRDRRSTFEPGQVAELFSQVDRTRVAAISKHLGEYLETNLPIAIAAREKLSDYRTNPYVLMTTASVMGLAEPTPFAQFLFDTKLYMALETSFGKSVEPIFDLYPISGRTKWETPKEKLKEFALLQGRTRETRARLRLDSIWREIDKSVVVSGRRYLVSIKSGPNTINDSQVDAMANAIIANHRRWADQSIGRGQKVDGIDVVIGLTYGTDRTTNNKENQIIVKLLEHGFEELGREKAPGVLVDGATRSNRAYRVVGSDFWAFIGNPQDPSKARFVFLEVLLALAKALSTTIKDAGIEARLNERIQTLAKALAMIQFPRGSLPNWVRDDFREHELFWFATAMSAFFDEGI